MSIVKDVVPWKCNICHSEFDAPGGGICARCNRATCRSHLHEIGKKVKPEYGWVCDNCLTGEEKADKIAQSKSILRINIIAVVVLLALGFLIDLFSGFYVLRHSTSLYAGVAGLLIVAIFSLIGESGSEWIGGKDDVSHPLYKRVFRLLVLLLFAGLILATMWSAVKLLGLIP